MGGDSGVGAGWVGEAQRGAAVGFAEGGDGQRGHIGVLVMHMEVAAAGVGWNCSCRPLCSCVGTICAVLYLTPAILCHLSYAHLNWARGKFCQVLL
jgi:hypothetical protein